MKNNDETPTTTAKPKRNKYTSQFKEQALERVKQDGVSRSCCFLLFTILFQQRTPPFFK